MAKLVLQFWSLSVIYTISRVAALMGKIFKFSGAASSSSAAAAYTSSVSTSSRNKNKILCFFPS